MHSKKWRDLVVYSTEILIAIIGLLIIFTWSSIFDSIRNRNLELNEASKSYQFWIKTPMPLYMELYLYNWTNSQEFLRDKTIKPAFNQVGPFVFREVHERNNITWNNNFTVTYNQTRTWYFLSDESVNLSVPITNLNVVLTVSLYHSF